MLNNCAWNKLVVLWVQRVSDDENTRARRRLASGCSKLADRIPSVVHSILIGFSPEVLGVDCARSTRVKPSPRPHGLRVFSPTGQTLKCLSITIECIDGNV